MQDSKTNPHKCYYGDILKSIKQAHFVKYRSKKSECLLTLSSMFLRQNFYHSQLLATTGCPGIFHGF